MAGILQLRAASQVECGGGKDWERGIIVRDYYFPRDSYPR